MTQAHLDNALKKLQRCSLFYFNGLLVSCMENYTSCSQLPAECSAAVPAIFNTLHFLTDHNFMDVNNTNVMLSYAMLILDVRKEFQGELLKHLDSNKHSLGGSHVQIVAIDTDQRYPLFQRYILRDSLCFGIAMVLILICVYLYIQSMFLTFTTMFYMIGSFILAYVVYHFIYQQRFFSFVNLLAALLLIALGADNVFIFNDIWKMSVADNPKGKIVDWLTCTMKHVFLTVFATSMTTAGSFFANALSSIEAIRYFGVFCGTTIVCSYLLVITFLPAVTVIDHIITQRGWHLFRCCKSTRNCDNLRHYITDIVFNKILSFAVWKLRYIFLIVFGGIGIYGMIVVFYKPKLDLSDVFHRQYFKDGHIAEAYWEEYRYYFRFIQQASNNRKPMDISFVWGMESALTNNRLNTSSVKYDNTFSLSEPQEQAWMLEFCDRLKTAPFVSKDAQQLECNLQKVKTIVQTRCAAEQHRKHVCCKQSVFSQGKFDKCLLNVTFESDNGFANDSLGISYFDVNNGNLKAYQIIVPTTLQWTADYYVMRTLYGQIKEFTEEINKVAPPGIRNGWFSGNFLYFDLQNTLASDTYVAIGISLAAAFVVIILTTCDIALTIFALVGIFSTIMITFGIFTLLGWKLEILESSIFSLSVGLSVDFTLHYGVAYRISKASCPRLRVKDVLTTVGPSIAMGAFTTMLAGVALMPVRVRSYFKFGIFLMTVMATSWLVSTFLFLALCAVFNKITGHGCCNKNKKSVPESHIPGIRIDHVGALRSASDHSNESPPNSACFHHSSARSSITNTKESTPDKQQCHHKERLANKQNTSEDDACQSHQSSLSDMSESSLYSVHKESNMAYILPYVSRAAFNHFHVASTLTNNNNFHT